MASKRSVKTAYPLYAVATAAFILYFVLELNGDMILKPFERIALLGAGCAGVYFGSLLRANATGKASAARIMRRAFFAFFALYILLLLTFTLFDDAFGRNQNGFVILWGEELWRAARESVNLIPFHTILLYIRGLERGAVTLGEFAVNLVGNLLAFTPMAFFLPLLFARCRSWWRVALVAALCVCAVELAQLILQKGYCDIDDLLLNVSGAAIAYFFIWSKKGAARIDKLTCGARFAKTGGAAKQ